MNIPDYLKVAKGAVWLMNDSCFLVWDKEWIVKETAFGKDMKHTIIYQGDSLHLALISMRGGSK